MHVLVTVNAAWNILNFRKGLMQALTGAGHAVTVLAPPDSSTAELQALGCRVLPLRMSAKGLNPLEGAMMVARLCRVLRREKPDIVLSYTIKNNIFGAFAARLCGVPFVPNVTGLGTAFLSGSLLQKVAELLYRRAFAPLPVIFLQNSDDRDLFVQRRLIRPDQARLLPGSGIDLEQFAAAAYPAEGEGPVFLMIARLRRDQGVLEYVEAARELRQRHPGARFQLLGAVAAENRTAIDLPAVEGWVREGVVEYLGTTGDVRPFIAAADLRRAAFLSRRRARILIEAAAIVWTLIVTDVPGCGLPLLPVLAACRARRDGPGGPY
jgi:glycosyltransferase involved in cell wall biosynthesis